MKPKRRFSPATSTALQVVKALATRYKTSCYTVKSVQMVGGLSHQAIARKMEARWAMRTAAEILKAAYTVWDRQ